MVRAAALLTLLAGCSDSEDDNLPDGGMDGGTDAGMDGGGDGGGPGPGDGGTDASTDAGPTDAGPSDAGNALADALRTEGVRADDARAALVIPAFCATAVRCNINDAGVGQSLCETSYNALWQANKGTDSVMCLDAQLDFISCVAATTVCNQLLNCALFSQAQEARCAGDGG